MLALVGRDTPKVSVLVGGDGEMACREKTAAWRGGSKCSGTVDRVGVVRVVFKEAALEEVRGVGKNCGFRGVRTRWWEWAGVLEGFNAGESGEDRVA